MEVKKDLMYSPFKIGKLTVQNRIVRSATFEFGAEEGRITPRIVDLYRQLAEGGSGLLITGMQAIASKGMSGQSMVDTNYEGYIEDMRKVTDAVHENESLIFVQLNHPGYKTNKSNGYDHFGVSELEMEEGITYQEMTVEQINGLARDFGMAAKRCKDAGCDGVQIHAAHGYLISTFISPYFNKRRDAYGGSIENRSRILFEVYDAIRSEVGVEFPISVKLHLNDRVSPSITPEECLYICKRLEEVGIDMIEVSSGLSVNGVRGASATPRVKDPEEGLFLDDAVIVAKEVSVPVVSVCGYRTPEFIENTLDQTPITAVSLCRPLVRQPDLPKQWRDNPTKATCISCNKCFTSKGIIACQIPL